MKFHLPNRLFQSLLACLSVGCLTLSSGNAMAEEQASLILGEQETLTIDYADADTLLHADGVLQLMGGTQLNLSNCGEGDGKTYMLATGVSSLLDAEGNELVLDSGNNAISHYFDTTQPGVGFWADATLSLTEDGTLQLVRHHETVKAAQTITTRQTETLVYNYYEGISFEDIDYNTSSSSASGCAICGYDDSTITLSGNGSVTFSGNTASAYKTATGGAIYGYGGTITLSGNGSVEFSGNTASTTTSSAYVHAYAQGGAIYGRGSTIMLSGNGNVTFSGNTASAADSADGGAIYGYGGTITLSGNESVEFSGNTASASSGFIAQGGAIYGNDSTITLSGNGSVTFSGNKAASSSSSSSTGCSEGGAIYGYDSTITLSGNGSVTFSGNKASASFELIASGGAIYGGSSTITLSGNGSVEFSGNTASSSSTTSSSAYVYAQGGAICGRYSTITLSGNGSVTFSGNKASSSYYYARGGAIYSDGSVTITGNDEVTFAQNVEKIASTYRLRSLYLAGNKLTLSAGKGQSIRFYDSVYMGAKGSVALNADYTDADGVTWKATGTILFSGATTEDDLKDAKGGVAGTEAEILNSRTSEINSAATLYGGTLQVQDKAVLKLNGGLTVAEGSKASVQVQAAELNVGSHALNMVSGSSLELSDGAKLTATELTITTGATLAVRGSVSTAPLTATVAALTLSDETVAGFDAARAVNTGSVSVLEGDLTLESGSLLSLDDGYLELSGDLFFDVAEGEEKIALDIAPGIITEANNQVVLFNVGGVVTFGFDALTTTADYGLVYSVKATDYFTGNRVTESMKLVYDSSTGMVYLENAAASVPEPTTTTLSLLALAALAARRRRK